METQIQAKTLSLNAFVVAVEGSKSCVLFLSGGSFVLGKERYYQWQEELAKAGISSVSFDHSGVNGSGTSLEKSSLKLRIEEAVHVADWIIERIPANRYVLYGNSMGGYIALGLIQEKPDLFDALILHAPAAYAPSSHNLPFGNEFSAEIRKEKSWSDSLSFDWLHSYKKPVLLIESGKDEIIPSPIIEKYKNAKNDEKLSLLVLSDAPHGIWGSSVEEKNFRQTIYNELVHFVQKV